MNSLHDKKINFKISTNLFTNHLVNSKSFFTFASDDNEIGLVISKVKCKCLGYSPIYPFTGVL